MGVGVVGGADDVGRTSGPAGGLGAFAAGVGGLIASSAIVHDNVSRNARWRVALSALPRLR